MKDIFIEKIIDGIDRIIDAEFNGEYWRERISIEVCIKRWDEIAVSIKEDHYVIIMEALLHYITINTKNLLLHPQPKYELLIDSNTVVITLQKNTINFVINVFKETSINASRVVIHEEIETNDELTKNSYLDSSSHSCGLWLFEGYGQIIPSLATVTIVLFVMTIVAVTGAIPVPCCVPIITGILLILFGSGLVSSIHDKVKKHWSSSLSNTTHFLASQNKIGIKKSNLESPHPIQTR